ncbi:acyltransferase [Lichenicola cladoniae]|uniref:Acyltransferase n=1 Tax=Lichenicola cladoniae TaxID=1484109 RepID=A0A6M8HXB5_9PROT|nr:acyltransferase [Acetobacteraceae bacterium]QKE92731.1 acyltransferase [Lichenicola cladoniae]
MPSLTGVRGIAAVWVFLSHFYGLAAWVLAAPSLLHSVFLFNGFRGVDLFFVLSGFILMHVHADQFSSIRRDDLRQFFLARFFRVYPLNTAMLLAMLVVVVLLPGYVATERSWTDPHAAYRAQNLSFPGFVQTLLLVQSWTVLKLGEWNIVSWTLSAEVLGYLLFPAMAWGLMRERSASRCVLYAVLSLVVLTAILFVAHHANNNPTGTFGSIRMIFCFLAGIALNRAYQIAGDRWVPAAVPMTVAACLFLLMTWFVPVLPVLDVFGFAALILGLAYQRGPIDAMLSSKLAISLGRISFSFYLVHFMIIKLVSWSAGEWLAMQSLSVRIAGLCGVVLMCLVAGIVCYRLVEQPSQRLGRKVTAGYRVTIERRGDRKRLALPLGAAGD